MRRREFITLSGAGAVAARWPAPARAQDRQRRVAFISAYKEGDPEALSRLAALRDELRKLRWTDNVAVEMHYGFGDMAHLRRQVAALVSSKPDVIVTTGTPVTLAVKAATKSIPIVFSNVSDPVGSHVVSSLARPGENVTGFPNYEPAIAGKWLETLKELSPSTKRVLLLFNPDNPSNVTLRRTFESAASALSMEITAAPIRDAADVKAAFEDFLRAGSGCLVTVPDARIDTLRDLFLPLAREHRMPAIYPFRFLAQAGGLMSYGISPIGAVRQSATYVDRILRGANPAELPVQNPTKLELVVNLKTAKAIGLKIPESFLLRADEVIE
jgi:putative ABC transport system substrate-binding protein